MNTRVLVYSSLVLCTVGLIKLGTWVEYRVAAETAPVARGAAYARVRGCVDCHGDPDNPSADANDDACSDVNQYAWHPDYNVNCADAISYFEVVRLRRSFDERAKAGSSLVAGEALARKYHCFQCHGQLGQGGFANEGSLKGYVPGYFGDDFRLLTRNADPNSVRAWVTGGMDEHIVEKPVTGPIARFFFKRQAVSMPSFSTLSGEEIETLVGYVIALHEFGPMTADTLRRYDTQSRAIADTARSVSGGKLAESVTMHRE